MESKKIKILAIDDNTDNLISVKALIKDIFPAALTYTATSGEKGIEIAAAEDPFVILLDIIMPDMDGFETCSRIKADPKLCDIPVVFLTASKADQESRLKALECGAEAFLTKPIDEGELSSLVRAMVKIRIANAQKRDETVRLAALVNERTRDLKETHLATLNLLEDLKYEITKRRKSEEALREREEHFRAVTQTANDAIITANERGAITGWNKGAEKIFGYTAGEILGKELIMLMSPLYVGRHLFSISKLRNNSHTQPTDRTLELTGLRKNGSEFPLELSLSHWESASGKFFTGIIRDITDRKRAELELTRAKEKAEESNRLKSAFLSNMSHEIRTPMNGILGFTELLKDPQLTGEEQKEYIGIIEKSGARMLNIINDIISISKVESGLMEVLLTETNLNEMIDYLYAFFKPEADQKGIQLIFVNKIPEAEAVIRSDADKIQAILTNLIKNALKFTREGSIEIEYSRKGRYFEFLVKDTGCGIRNEHKDIIFERFRQGSESLTREYEGAGLGLAISKAYTELLGGKISMESEYGKGSVFSFTVIQHDESEPMQLPIENVPLPDTEKSKGNLKILIAEDDKTSEILMSLVIKMLGKELIVVRNGKEAVEACRNNPDIDLIMMDVKMPEMDGYEATREIRKFNTEVKIIAQTAYGLVGEREKALDAGCNDYISKPLNLELFKVLVQKHFKN